MRLFLLILLCTAVTQAPYAQAYWGPLPQQEKSKTIEYLRYAGDSVKEGLGKGKGVFRIGYEYSLRGIRYSKEKKEGGLYYIKIAKEQMYPLLDDTKDYAGNLANLPTILPILSQDQWLRYLRTLTASSATKFDKAMDSKYIKTAMGGGNHRLFDGSHTIGGAWNSISRMCAKTGCSGKEEVNGYFRALWKDASTPKGLPFMTMERETYNSLAEKLGKYGISRKWTYDALSYDAAEVLAAGIAVAAVVYHLKTGQMEELSEALGVIGVTSIASANPLLALVVISSVAYAIATGTDLNSTAAAEGILKSAIISGALVFIPGAFLLQITAAVAVSLLLEKNMTEEKYSFAKDYMLERSLILKYWFERKWETGLVAREPSSETEDCILFICP